MSIARAFPPLSQDDVRIAAKGRVDVIANPLARLNASHERLTGAAAPGQAGRVFRPHNHVLDGGAILGRGTIFSFDVGAIANGTTYYSWVLAGTATWESMLGTSLTRECAFRAYVTPGLTGTLACRLVVRSYGVAVDIRIANIDTSTASSAATTAASSNAQKVTISDIPMTAGQYNRFDIEIRASATDTLDVLGFCLYEDTATHPATSGSTTYSGL